MKVIYTLKIKFILIMMLSVFSLGIAFTYFNFTNQLEHMRSVISSYHEFIDNFLDDEKSSLSNKALVKYRHMSLMFRLALLSMKDNAYDKEKVKQIMFLFIKQKGMLAAIVYDENKNIILSAYKQNGEIIFKKVPNSILLDANTKHTVRALDESKAYNTGTLESYFNNKPILKPTNDLLSNLLNNFNTLENSFKEEEERISLIHRFSALLYIFMIITAIYLIIQVLINKPIRKIRHALEVFFIAFRNKNKSMKKIKLNTKDEFGDMANMLNNNMDDVLSLHSILQKTQNKLQDSIAYAAIIQSNIIAKQDFIDKFFIDNFIYWKPRDVVGGDIYFCNVLNEDECLLMCIDCTGHGVSGAFITVLTKSIHHNITTDIKNNPKSYKEKISPSYIMGQFNKSIKKILKQKNENSKTNVGFDGGIVYINKKTKEVKYTGANNLLLIIDEKGESKIIKGDNYSVGYNACDKDYQYQEHTITIKDNTKLYLSTDGYVDQMGGDKGFRFGMKRFKNMIDENHNKSFEKQKDIYIEILDKYASDKEIVDDITFIGVLL